MPIKEKRKFYTTAELAELLHTNPQVIRASRVSGMLFEYTAPKFIKLSRNKVLYPVTEVNKYVRGLELKQVTY